MVYKNTMKFIYVETNWLIKSVMSCTTNSNCSIGYSCYNNLCSRTVCNVDANCPVDYSCVNGYCESTAVMTVEGVVGYLVFGIICAALSWWRFPIDLCGSKNRLTSTLFAFFLPGLYILVFAWQASGTSNNARSNACLNCFLACCFWPLLFLFNGETNELVKSGAAVGTITYV